MTRPTAELVEGLRSRWFAFHRASLAVDQRACVALCDEAAAALERLEAENAKLKKDYEAGLNAWRVNTSYHAEQISQLEARLKAYEQSSRIPELDLPKHPDHR